MKTFVVASGMGVIWGRFAESWMDCRQGMASVMVGRHWKRLKSQHRANDFGREPPHVMHNDHITSSLITIELGTVPFPYTSTCTHHAYESREHLCENCRRYRILGVKRLA